MSDLERSRSSIATATGFDYDRDAWFDTLGRRHAGPVQCKAALAANKATSPGRGRGAERASKLFLESTHLLEPLEHVVAVARAHPRERLGARGGLHRLLVGMIAHSRHPAIGSPS